ncbi:unnamed protein product [Adineta steineri]|uniref:Metalloendopeptidase n=1 Tax=Adineta steineri TaxID=433720 RepID=A0A814LMU4_9BILA|nr:unnamed protein product [Adineta steineri]CAF1382605.1 unnamed protein product [Adineta steineri]
MRRLKRLILLDPNSASFCVQFRPNANDDEYFISIKNGTLDFWHEQLRPDHDDYVTINFNNVQQGREHNFNKYLSDVTDTLDLPYDYNSKNGLATIMTEDPNVRIGQRYTLSTNDIAEIQRYYQRS